MTKPYYYTYDLGLHSYHATLFILSIDKDVLPNFFCPSPDVPRDSKQTQVVTTGLHLKNLSFYCLIWPQAPNIY
jgi:hypothetical protein